MIPNLERIPRDWYGTFHIEYDLSGLGRMIQAFSLKLSKEARMRLSWMDYYRFHPNAALVSRHFGIPVRTFWFWRQRYDPFDLTTLEAASRKPRTSPLKTEPRIEMAILDLKREHPRWGREKLQLLLQEQDIRVSSRTISRVLRRHHFAPIITYRTRKPPKPRVKRKDIHLPGDLLELDTKYIRHGSRWLFQYTLIDVVTRYRQIDLYPSLNMETTTLFLQRSLNILPFPAKIIQTDNGKEFGKNVTKWIRAQGIKHVFTRKSRPVENSHVERSHRTDEVEFYQSGNMGRTFEEIRDNLASYLLIYNLSRPHWGLEGKTPNQAVESYSLTGQVCKMS